MFSQLIPFAAAGIMIVSSGNDPNLLDEEQTHIKCSQLYQAPLVDCMHWRMIEDDTCAKQITAQREYIGTLEEQLEKPPNRLWKYLVVGVGGGILGAGLTLVFLFFPKGAKR